VVPKLLTPVYPGGEGTDGDGMAPNQQPGDDFPGFCAWLAGGGIKGGVQHGATDALGFHAIENPHYITDIHATVMHQLGLDSHQLEIPGRKRLALDHGVRSGQITKGQTLMLEGVGGGFTWGSVLLTY
jgi:hypothetical protein